MADEIENMGGLAWRKDFALKRNKISGQSRKDFFLMSDLNDSPQELFQSDFVERAFLWIDACLQMKRHYATL